ncbi:MAG: hypothetical protein HYU66_13005 [Armatimonadetes bacterium]|nr:hypothetical protein [Armatimonadota bacterium]
MRARLSSPWRCVLGPDNPFWLLAWRQGARRGDASLWWPPFVIAGGSLFVWRVLTAVDLFTRWPAGRWHLVVAGQAAVIAVATALAAARMLTEAGEAGNTTALRMARLRPGETVLGKALQPALVGLRTVLVCLPLVLVLKGLEGPSGPAVSGLVGLYLGTVVHSLFLAAGSGAAAVRSRAASLDDWGNFLFNLRTLFPLFLNPLWIFLGLLALLGRGPQWATWGTAPQPWYGTHLHPLWLLLPAALWVARCTGGLSLYVYGETPRLSRRITAAMLGCFLAVTLLLTGFNWQRGLETGGLADWWELTGLAPQPGSAMLLLTLFVWYGWPLCLAAGYTATLTCGLRGDVDETLDRLPPAARALPRVLAASLAAGAVPFAAWAAALELGRWSPFMVDPAWLARTGWLVFAAAALSGGYLALMVLMPRYQGLRRDLASVAVVLPPLVTPFALRSGSPAVQVLTVFSPLTALLWVPPDAATGSGLLGELNLKLPWPAVVGGSLAVAALLFAVAARAIARERARGLVRGVERSAGGGWWRERLANPLLRLDLLRLQRRGALLTPLVMLVMPAIAQIYGRLDPLLESMVRQTCGLFLWPRELAREGPPLARFLPILFGAIGLQLLIHPVGLAASRSFSREAAAGRLGSLFATPLTVPELVRARYLSILAPVAVFLVVVTPGIVWLGWVAGEPVMAVSGLIHWLALALLVPAAVLAGSVDKDWRGQGLGLVAALELARLIASGFWPRSGDPELGMLVSNVAFAVAACLTARWQVDRTVRRVAALRSAGEA